MYSSPEERLGCQALLYSSRQCQILVNVSLMLFEASVCFAKASLGVFLFRNIRQCHNREALLSRFAHHAHAHHYGQSFAVLRGQQERLATPPLLMGFLSKGLEAGIVFGSQIHMLNGASDDFAAKCSAHSLEDRIDEDDLPGV